MTYRISFLFLVLLFAQSAFAQRFQPRFSPNKDTPLDPPYHRVSPAPIFPSFRPIGSGARAVTPDRSNTLQTLKSITPIRDQGGRGTCSIFAATALFEAMIAIQDRVNPAQIDFSEQWLQYLIGRTSSDYGSTTYADFTAIKANGMVRESTLPYNESTIEPNTAEFTQFCGKVPANFVKSCMVAQRDPRLLTTPPALLLDQKSPMYDPEFLKIREEAFDFRDKRHLPELRLERLNTEDEIKATLKKGIPVIVGMDVYYGAWNHRRADTYGIGRDVNSWAQGIIGYPEPGSKDRDISRKNRAGHAVMIVGYDDGRVVNTVSNMNDGTQKKFQYQGVYYLKNSWGTDSFGISATIDGATVPGYGVITQKYANEEGEFFRVVLK